MTPGIEQTRTVPYDFEVIAEGLVGAEGPVAMADGSVILVETGAGRVTRCWGDGRSETVATTGGGPNGAAIGADGALYVCNNGGINADHTGHGTGPGFEGRIERIDLATGKVERLYDAFEGQKLSAPNDLVVDADGGLWFSDFGKYLPRAHEHGALYHARPDGTRLRRVHYSVIGYNGVGLSPDGATVYVSETFSGLLVAFEARPETEGLQRRLIGAAPGLADLDSLAVTAAGNICVASPTAGNMLTFTPAGGVSAMPLPPSLPTNIAFGGNDMRTAYITLMGTGTLIRTRWPEQGLRLNFNS